ncbi:hypothetical protein BBJ28_00020395, partial [Nothophytophthora sp. Chile5]
RCVVEFRRTNGACLKFHEVYKLLNASLSDLVWDGSEVEATDDSPAEELISDEAMMI